MDSRLSRSAGTVGTIAVHCRSPISTFSAFHYLDISPFEDDFSMTRVTLGSQMGSHAERTPANAYELVRTASSA